MTNEKIVKVKNFMVVLTIVLCVVLFIYIGIYGKLNIYAPRGMGASDSSDYMKITEYTKSEVVDEDAPIGIVKEYRFNIPYTISMDNSIMFYIYHHDVEVFIGGEEAYKMTLHKSSGIGKTPACEWVSIPVTKNDMGKSVLIKIAPIYESVENSQFVFYYGNDGVVVSQIVMDELPHILIAGICIFVGILMIAAKILLHKKVSYYPKESTYLGILAIMIGIWKVADSEVAPMIFDINPVVLGYIPLVILFLCMIPIAHFVGYRFKDENTREYHIGSLILWTLPAVVILAQLFNLSDMRENLYLAHFTMIVVTLTVAVRVVKENIKNKENPIKGNPKILVLGIGAIIDVVIFYTGEVATDMIFTMIGFLIYTIGMFGELIFEAIDDGKRLESLVEERTKELKDSLEKAEAGAKAKSTFLFNMSHDIRTPMNAVLGFNEIAKQNIDDKEKVLEALEKAQFSGEYMVSIINDILDMSLIESGKMKLNRELVDVNESVKDIMELFTKESEQRNIDFEVQIRSCPRKVYGDVLRMTQLFTNLISNAFKFTPSGGKVVVSIDDEVLENDNVKYIVHVKDNGQGMSKEFQKILFNAFEREKSATESGVKGTGLGLAIVKSIVELMNGTITVESEEGKGTDFCVEIVTKIVEDIFEENQETEKLFTAHGKRILLVEDNMLNREIAKEMLIHEGFLVEEAENGSAACEMILDSIPGYYHAVLMDIQMPVMDGYQATEKIRSFENDQLAQIPIVAMTANTFAEDRAKSLEVGMNEHISKPISVQNIVETLKKVIK